MSLPGLVLCLVLPLTAEAAPGSIVLFAEQKEYRDLKTEEKVYEGLLQRNPGTGKLGARFNPYRWAGQEGGDKPLTYELRVPDKAHLLADLAGQRVQIVGKLVPVEVDGKTIQELWPARVEPLSVNLTERPGTDGIYARVSWQPAEARQRGSRQYVFRNGEQLARALRLVGPTTDQTATHQFAQQLRVPEIDWKKHMLVSVCAGLSTDVERLVITKAHVQDDTLTISYKKLGGAGGFGYPAETVLLDRFDGPVRFVEEPPARPAVPQPRP